MGHVAFLAINCSFANRSSHHLYLFWLGPIFLLLQIAWSPAFRYISSHLSDDHLCGYHISLAHLYYEVDFFLLNCTYPTKPLPKLAASLPTFLVPAFQFLP